MKKTGLVLAVVLVLFILLTITITGYPQTTGTKAEEFLKRLDGATFTKSFSSDCERFKLTIDIRGEYLTYGIIYEWATSECKPPNVTIGQWWRYGSGRIVNKRFEGDELILETDYSSVQKVFITGDGFSLTACQGDRKCGGGFLRQR